MAAAAATAPTPAAETKDGTLNDSAAADSFQCCVCLDLLYKPVVLACGHISCFWCVHKAMHGLRTSHCAICRRPYNHFPGICQLFHHVLLKLEPVEYKRREKEVLDEERDLNIFSPQDMDGVISETVHYASSGKHNSGNLEEMKKPDENLINNTSIASEGLGLPENGRENGMCKQVSVDDVLCSMCNELLFKPAVLNCGHVYCESCLPGLTSRPLSCHVCQSQHPGELPNVCLDLDHFLEERFPREYAARRDYVHLQELHQREKGSFSSVRQTEEHNAESSSRTKKRSHMWFNEDLSNAHFGVGCDSCGVYPIYGKRYRCKDCKEIIGFDLCDSCYNTNSKRPGRFNQQHTPDHEFELDDSKLLGKMLSFTSLPLVDAHQQYIEVFGDGDEAEYHFDIHADDLHPEGEAEDHFDRCPYVEAEDHFDIHADDLCPEGEADDHFDRCPYVDIEVFGDGDEAECHFDIHADDLCPEGEAEDHFDRCPYVEAEDHFDIHADDHPNGESGDCLDTYAYVEADIHAEDRPNGEAKGCLDI